jgi:hypothetical protein
MSRPLQQVGRADDAHRAALEDVGVDHGGVEIRVAHQFLNGSDVLPALQQLGRERRPEGVATCRFDETCAFYGLLHSLLHHPWIQLVAAFFSTVGVLPAVPLGKHPLPSPSPFPLSVPILIRQRTRQDHRSPTHHPPAGG